MEQTMNRDAGTDDGDARGSWRSIGSVAGSWADRIAVVRLARAAGEPASALAAHLGLAAE